MQFHSSGRNAEETLSVARGYATAAVDAAKAAQSSASVWSGLSGSISAASGAFTTYLQTNNNISEVEASASAASTECATTGVTVTLDQ